MCLILLSFQETERYPLILAANRDEYYERPTAPAEFWEDAPDVLAGRDLLHGGTWLGVTLSGRIAAITNFRSPESRVQGIKSRGLLVSDYLRSDQHPEEYLRSIDERAEDYSGFNLILGSLEGLYYYSNRERLVRKLAPGVYGLSNHFLDTPWPKVARGKRALSEIARDSEAQLFQDAFQILENRSVAPDSSLPDTGITRELELALSASFISVPGYGTRASTVIMVDRLNQGAFIERSFEEGSHNYSEVAFRFAITPYS